MFASLIDKIKAFFLTGGVEEGEANQLKKAPAIIIPLVMVFKLSKIVILAYLFRHEIPLWVWFFPGAFTVFFVNRARGLLNKKLATRFGVRFLVNRSTT